MNWDWDYEGFGELLQGPEMEAEMHAQAEAIRDRAVAIAPEVTGDYRRSFEVSSGVEATMTGRRAVARVTNTSDHALAVEYGRGGRSGTPGHKPHYPLTRALDG